MFEHVNGEQLMVKRSHWGSHRDPDQEQANQKTDRGFGTRVGHVYMPPLSRSIDIGL